MLPFRPLAVLVLVLWLLIQWPGSSTQGCFFVRAEPAKQHDESFHLPRGVLLDAQLEEVAHSSLHLPLRSCVEAIGHHPGSYS